MVLLRIKLVSNVTVAVWLKGQAAGVLGSGDCILSHLLKCHRKDYNSLWAPHPHTHCFRMGHL